MREIIFRGRIVGTKEWAYGSLVAYPDGEYNILTSRSNHSPKMDDWLVEVDTIGQFTGLYDKNGKEIYEGDIVYHRTYRGHKACIVRFECGAFIVGYHEGSSTKIAPMLINKSCVVIGNIHDNPELLRKEEENDNRAETL